MKQKDVMQSSLLQQNLFFENPHDEDITQYQLKKPSSKTPASQPSDNTQTKPKKQKNSQITSFMNKVNKQSLTVKLEIGKVQLEDNDGLQVKDITSKPEIQQIPVVNVPKPQKRSKKLSSKQSFVQIIGFESEENQSKPNQSKQPSKQRLSSKKTDENQLGLNQKKCTISSNKTDQKDDQKKLQKKRKLTNLCLAFQDQDSESQELEKVKQKLEEKENIRPIQRGKFKKVNYLSKKSLNQAQSVISPNKTVKDQFSQQIQEIKKPQKEEKNQQKMPQKQVEKLTKKESKNEKNKKPLLLMNFDEDQDEQSQKSSSSSQDFEDVIQMPKAIRKSNKSIDSVSETKETTDSKATNNQNKILLNDFDDDEDSSDQSEALPNRNPILLKNASIDSSQDISSSQEHINLTRPINILEFSRMNSSLAYVYEPIPPNCIFQTIIKRYQGSSESNVIYQMFDYSTYKSILKVRHCSEGFQIFSSKESLGGSLSGNSKIIPQTDQETSCALLCSNFLGTQFNCFKFNRNNQKPDSAKLNRLITINYETNLFGLNGPRRMQTYIPSANYLVRGGKNLQEVYESEKSSKLGNEPLKIEYFVNKKPKWNNEISSFVLNFNGRATVSSVKNFIIIRPSESKNQKEVPDNLVLFGKIEKNVFNLDIKHPFNLIQGLALALSSFDKKIACE